MDAVELRGKMPYPPSINRYWQTSLRKSRNPHTGQITTVKAVGKRKEVANYFKQVYYTLNLQRLQPQLKAERLKIELFIYPPDNRKRDLDNVLKAILDALQYAKVFTDDFQIWKLLVERREVKKGGEVEFKIRGIDDANL